MMIPWQGTPVSYLLLIASIPQAWAELLLLCLRMFSRDAQVPSCTMPPPGYVIHAEICMEVPVEHGESR